MNSSASDQGVHAVHDVALVGTGLVGLACALGAAQAGLRVKLIGTLSDLEPIPGEMWDRRVYAISAASRRFLERLRVWDHLDVQRIAPVRDMHIYSKVEATRALHFSAYEAASEALAWIIEHRELNRVLNTALRFAHGVEFCPAKAIAYEIGAEGVRIATDGGDAVRAALLIGADGSNSSVRTAAGLCARSKPYGQSGVVANFECEFAHGGAARQWFADDSILALLPLPDRACSMVWSAPTALAGELVALDPTELAQRVAAIAGTHTGVLTALGGASAFPLNLVTASALAVPRVALVGDAAHVVHPLAGQGLNLGFQDAEDLLRILREREVFRDCGDPVLMRRYERARAFPVMAMRSATDGLQRLFGARSSGIRVLRSEGMNFVQGLSVVKKALIRYAMS